jgi:hypothetical protein
MIIDKKEDIIMKVIKTIVKFSFALLGLICTMSAISVVILVFNTSSDNDAYYDCT